MTINNVFEEKIRSLKNENYELRRQLQDAEDKIRELRTKLEMLIMREGK